MGIESFGKNPDHIQAPGQLERGRHNLESERPSGVELPYIEDYRGTLESNHWKADDSEREFVELPHIEDEYYSTSEEWIEQTPKEDGDRGEWSVDRRESDFTLNDEEIPDDELIYEMDMEMDDNGEVYRVGKELLPESQYELNGYRYETDGQSRITSVEGKLHLKDREERLPIRDSIEDIGKGDQREGDDRGHLIGDQFDGSNGLENMVPQDAGINRIDFKNFENELAREVKAGKDVEIMLEPVYDGNSRRPSAIVSTYRIDGEEYMRMFPNGKEG